MMRMHPLILHHQTILKSLALLVIFFTNSADGSTATDALIKKHQVPESKLSILLEDSESGERLININPNASRSPGSVAKLSPHLLRWIYWERVTNGRQMSLLKERSMTKGRLIIL